MPVETFMRTHDRTVISYLTKPLRPSDASFRIRRFVASLGASAHPPQQGQGRTVLGLSDRLAIWP